MSRQRCLNDERPLARGAAEIQVLRSLSGLQVVPPAAPNVMPERLNQLQRELVQLREELWRLTRENQHQAVLLNNFRRREMELRRQFSQP